MNGYEAIRQAAAWVELARDQVALLGKDAVDVLHKLCSNDVAQLQPGQGREAFVCSVQGKTLAHIWAFRLADGLLIDTAAGQGGALIAHFDRYIIREDVRMTDRSDSLRSALLAGPQAADCLLQAGCAEPPGELEQRSWDPSGDDRPLLVRRLPWGPDVFQLLAPADRLSEIHAAAAAAGAVDASGEDWETCRIEHGLPMFGPDISDDNLPQEVRRDEQAISFVKGCYLGQETVARIDARGHVNRLLCGLQLPDDETPPAGLELRAGEKTVGHVTSACRSPRLQAPLALAYVRREHASPGSQLDSEIGPATVVQLPLS